MGDEWRLCFSSEGRLVSPNYITLSYCWGSKPYLKLSRSNADQLRQNQPISQLPQTFKEAILVARHFSVRTFGSIRYVLYKTQLNTGNEKPEQ